jgi:hypothetical protein
LPLQTGTLDFSKVSYQRVVNTTLPVLFDIKAKNFYLCGGEIWYTATNALGPLELTTVVPETYSGDEKGSRQAVAGKENKAAKPAGSRRSEFKR